MFVDLYRFLSRPAVVGFLLLITFGQGASAIPIQVNNVAANWGNVTRGANLEFIDLDGIFGAEELRWGGNVSTANKSGYRFSGSSSAYDVENESNITLGVFTHINQTILAGTSIRTADLSLLTQIIVPGFDPVELPLYIRFRQRETTNDCSSSPTCANDLVTLVVSQTDPIKIGNTLFRFDEIGFMYDGLLLSEFSTVEETDNHAPLVARVTSATVPVPGTLSLMFAAGMAMLFVRRKRTAVCLESRFQSISAHSVVSVFP